MGTFNVAIQTGDPQGQRFEEVEALVDTGPTLTTVPASLLRSLGGAPRRRATFRLANNQRVERDVGVTIVRVEGLETSTSVVFGDEGRALLDALTLEDLFLSVSPVEGRLVPVEGLLMAEK